MKSPKKLIKQLSKTHTLSVVNGITSHYFFKPIAITLITSFILFLTFNLTKNHLLNSDSINPGNVKWQYFFLDKNGKIASQTNPPKDKKIIAVINGATFAYPKQDTPKQLKKNIARILTPKNTELSVALPREDLSVMQKYYGKTNFFDEHSARIEDVYVTLRMHNDLRNSTKDQENFFTHESRFEGTIPAKEGAEQFASAIINGYDIWSYAGGNSLVPKLELCEEYFAKNFDHLRAAGKLSKKVKYVGFSNSTAMAFYLRGLVDYALGYGVSYSFESIDDYPEDNSTQSLSNQVVALFRTFRGEDVAFTREFKASDIEDFNAAKTRYEEVIVMKKLLN